ncbi:glycosyl transferase family 2 [Halogeometricum limi]|uniref:Glucosyl-3-phosphoglycerate synthase n=1 Tax=Halogeometricum limi TaxID=555875 RepID=A0A1I6G6J4_9EURY|nr:glycosyl transferase family 2 [Halogeometricum limi]SFR37805.1 glucosyl-3-phosphoglycerate synthase [Halogeometricum limi]
MEYVQERVTTLHDLADPVPDAPTDRTAVVVPMTEREYAGLAADSVLSELERIDPARVVVPLRAPAERVGPFREWLSEYDLSLDVLWCDGPRVADVLDAEGLNGASGKGRDVWLALGCAAREEFVVVHDADTKTYDRSYVSRLLFPLANGYQFSKGYYARVEDRRLYGRLFRLFYTPLVRALADETPAPILQYLSAFRYALAGEFAATSELARSIRAPRSWGLEVGVLGDAFDFAGFDGAAQVDLGAYEHDHRAVSGPTGLSDMSESVGETLLRTVTDHGVAPDFETLPARYRDTALRLVDQYAADAAFNGFEFDRAGEREQVDAYLDAVVEPTGADDRLPAWSDAPVSAEEVCEAATADAEEVSS